jgi:TonB family protein
MGYIFINTRLSPEDAGEIIRHEQNHLKQNHFYDIIFIEIIKSFQWFNPVMYLFDKSLRAVHEYHADQECLSSGIPVTNYQSLLLCQVFKSRAFNLSNSFSNPSLVKKRMLMMTRKRTPALANIKLLTVIPLIAIVFLAISAYRGSPVDAGNATADYSLAPPPPPPPVPSGSENISEETTGAIEPFVKVDEMPQFPGGEGALMKYIGENTSYPEFSKVNHIQGKVIVRFCISEKGEVNRVGVLQGVSAELDAEAIRVVKTLPTFRPGRQGGKDVPVWFMVPISFTLR